jgi:glycosyltransferase involved in cell wall biosynthesis
MEDFKDVSFTVIIPYRNNLETIQNTLSSVVSQTYLAQRTILVDDASEDKESIEKICRAFGVEIIRNEANIGAGLSRTKAAQLVDTSHIALLDADDFWHPYHLEVHRKLWVSASSDLTLVGTTMTRQFYTGLTVLQQDDSHFDPPKILKLTSPRILGLALSNPFFNSATSLSTFHLREVDFWGVATPSYAEDYELIAKLINRKLTIGFCDVSTGIYFQMPNSKSRRYEEVYLSRIASSKVLIESLNMRPLNKAFVSRLVFSYIRASTLLSMAKNDEPYISFSHPGISQSRLSLLLLNSLNRRRVWSILRPFLKFSQHIHLSKAFHLLHRTKSRRINGAEREH